MWGPQVTSCDIYNTPATTVKSTTNHRNIGVIFTNSAIPFTGALLWRLPQHVLASLGRAAWAAEQLTPPIPGSLADARKQQGHPAWLGVPEMGVPQMDGLFQGKSHLQMDDD